MRKMISSPAKMPLSEVENQIYQKVLNLLPDIMLNLMAVKVNSYPTDFAPWCAELYRICDEDINFDLLEPSQLPLLKKLQGILESGVSVSQLKMLRVAPWPIFNGFIQQNIVLQSVEERIALLDYLYAIKDKPLAEMIEEDRLMFAGKHASTHDIAVYKFDAQWFGSTKGAKIFHELFHSFPEEFDAALSYIPLIGEVNDENYQSFVKAYTAIFTKHSSDKKAPLMPATRLLAMRRPDQFIVLTNANVDVICQGLNIVKLNNSAFDDYWHDLIGSLRVMPWWNASKPNKDVIYKDNECDDIESQIDVQRIEVNEVQLWHYRAILVDLFLFANKETAQKSNYLRLLNKARNKNKLRSSSNTQSNKVNKGVAGATTRKYTKESVESLVDKALANEELPPYLLNKRDSIIKAVKEGKTVEHVIKVMRAIFG